jgi:hypothetical protein
MPNPLPPLPRLRRVRPPASSWGSLRAAPPSPPPDAPACDEFDIDEVWETAAPPIHGAKRPAAAPASAAAAAPPAKRAAPSRAKPHPNLQRTPNTATASAAVVVDPAAEKPRRGGGGGGGAAFRAAMNRGPPPKLHQKVLPTGLVGCLQGLAFVVTGILESLDRDEAKQLIEHYGGKVMGNVGKSTTHVVVGTEPGLAKLEKMKQLQNAGSKIDQVDEEGLFELIRSRDPAAPGGGGGGVGGGPGPVSVEADGCRGKGGGPASAPAEHCSALVRVAV